MAHEPLVTPSAQRESRAPRIQTAAGGIQSSYIPHYEGDQLLKISEERSRANGVPARGQYEFRGARLVRYQGAAFQDDQALSVKFSLEGTLVEARKGDGEAPEDEIVHVRRRAQLLRSHALAQQASKMHTVNH